MATYDLTQSVPAANELRAGDILNCPYSGAKVTIQLPPGRFSVHCWGAQGGSYNENNAAGGKGGWTFAPVTLTDYVTAYLYAGGKGGYGTTNATTINGGGFNGGGNVSYRGGAGGGASDIRFGADSLYSRGIVAAGGGGAYAYSSTYKAAGGFAGGYPGGASGSTGSVYSTTYAAFAGVGANGQTAGAGGTGSATTYDGGAGTFGAGGSTARAYSTSYYSNGAGGGGWYGGGAAGNYYGSSRTRAAGGGGGNGWLATSDRLPSAPSGFSLPSSVTVGIGNIFGGNASFTDPDGTTVTGHAGDGYIRITVNAVTRKPTTPTDLAVTTAYDSATLTWTGDTFADSYTLYKNGVQVASGVMATSYTFTGLDEDTTYTFGVKAVNTNGSSSTATKSAATRLTPPASLTVEGVTAYAVMLTWPAAPIGSGLTARVYRGSTLIASVDAATVNHFTDTGRTPGATYTYKVAYYGSSLSDYATASATTAADPLALITDRTAEDVATGTEKGMYRAIDLNRVGGAQAYIAQRLTSNGISVSVTAKQDWTPPTYPSQSAMQTCLNDTKALRDALEAAMALPDSMRTLTYEGANQIEACLEELDRLITSVLEICLPSASVFAISGAPTIRIRGG